MSKILNLLKDFINNRFVLSITITKFNDLLNNLVIKIQTNRFKIFITKLKEFRTKFFQFIMFNFIFRNFKNLIFLRVFIFFLISSLFFLVIINNDFNIKILKIYFCIFVLTIFVLRFLFIDFAQTNYIQNLNLIFLYLNLIFFVLFFFNDLEFIFFELKEIILNFIKRFL